MLEDMGFSGRRRKIKYQTKQLFIYQRINYIKDILKEQDLRKHIKYQTKGLFIYQHIDYINKEQELRKHIKRNYHLGDGLQVHQLH
jgi:hypothetical protein